MERPFSPLTSEQEEAMQLVENVGTGVTTSGGIDWDTIQAAGIQERAAFPHAGRPTTGRHRPGYGQTGGSESPVVGTHVPISD